MLSCIKRYCYYVIENFCNRIFKELWQLPYNIKSVVNWIIQESWTRKRIITESCQIAAVTLGRTVVSYQSPIQHIKNPSGRVQLAAVKHFPFALCYIKNPSEEVQLAAVTQAGSAICYIKDPSEKIQRAAVNQDKKAIKYIKHPCEKIRRR